MNSARDLIETFYKDRVATRSGVPLINHINEGVDILGEIGSSWEARDAFLLHPMFQADEDLLNNHYLISMMRNEIDPLVMILVMEYRSVANEYLSYRQISNLTDIRLSPIKEVNKMLVADKVQNYRDFLKYHKDTHPRSKELDKYFNNWIDRLECRDIWEKLK